MKLVTAIIRPFKLDDVREALIAVGAKGITVTEAKGFGQEQVRAESHRSEEYHRIFHPKMRIEVIVRADQVEAVVEAIADAARTAKVGDGKIIVTDADLIVRIRTGERDEHSV